MWQTSLACCWTLSKARTTAGARMPAAASSMRVRCSSPRSSGSDLASYVAGSIPASRERVVELLERVEERLPVVADVVGRPLLQVAEDRQGLEQGARVPRGRDVAQLGLVVLHGVAVVVAAPAAGEQRGREHQAGGA